MCGRYLFENDMENQTLNQLMGFLSNDIPASLIPMGEIAPSMRVPVLTAPNASMIQSWGFPHVHGRGLLINARAETADSKPAFQQNLLHRRCAIPCTGFFEWDHNKHKYRFTLPGHSLFYLAGIYQFFENQPHFVILTTYANASISDIHDRMPVVLNSDQCLQWLCDTDVAMHILKQEVAMLARHSDVPEQMSLW